MIDKPLESLVYFKKV